MPTTQADSGVLIAGRAARAAWGQRGAAADRGAAGAPPGGASAGADAGAAARAAARAAAAGRRRRAVRAVGAPGCARALARRHRMCLTSPGRAASVQRAWLSIHDCCSASHSPSQPVVRRRCEAARAARCQAPATRLACGAASTSLQRRGSACGPMRRRLWQACETSM